LVVSSDGIPADAARKPAPFDHPEWVFELKYDGFQSLAVIQNGRTQLISRNGNSFKSFADLCKALSLIKRSALRTKVLHDLH
jgi:ATP-dependent DNA ligase